MVLGRATLLLSCALLACMPASPFPRCAPGETRDPASRGCIKGCGADADCGSHAGCTAAHACVCEPGFAQCDSGCQAESPAACGGACRACPGAPQASATCTQGLCGLQCNPGARWCGSACQQESAYSCGATCASCPGAEQGNAACVDHACVVRCRPGLQLCDGQCVGGTLEHCGGSCGGCPARPGAITACLRNACEYACAAGQHTCGGACVREGAASCGPSCAACAPGLACSSGRCVQPCATPGFAGLEPGAPPPARLAVNASAVVVADLDRDGHADLVAHSYSEGLVVWRGDGAGGFQRLQTLAAGPLRPNGLTLADVDGDGFPDLLLNSGAGPYSGGSLALYRNNGDGSLAAPVVLATGPAFGPVAVGDLDGDGHPDLVFGQSDPTAELHINVLYGTGAGFSPPVAMYSNEAPRGYNGALILDVDGDGLPDLIVRQDYNANGFVLFRGLGGRRFAPPSSWPGDLALVAAGDVDGDGLPDLVSGRTSATNPPHLWLGAPVGFRAGAAVEGDFNHAFDIVSAALLADIDGDGRADVLFGVSLATPDRQPGLWLWPADGQGAFRPAVRLGSIVPSSLAIADLDGDGRPDLIAATGDGILLLHGVCR